MIWRRSFLLALLAVTGLVFETSVLGGATLAGSKPELLLLATIALAMSEGPMFGAVAGFTFGFATDLLIGLPQGISAFSFTLVGYTVGRVRSQVAAPTAWLPIVMVFLATAAGVLVTGGVAAILGEPFRAATLGRHAALAAAYNALLTPFVYPVVRALGARLRPAGVAP